MTEPHSVENVIAGGCDAIILGAAITAGPARDAADPQSILLVNLLALVPILMAARRGRVGRIINLSSAAAYGAAAFRHALLDEEMACDPVSLYAITKYASEKVAARLAALWQSDIISVRLSGVFGPWERATGLRDTPSAQMQIIAALKQRGEAVLSRPGYSRLDLRPGCRRRRGVADRSDEAHARPLQYLDWSRIFGVAMGSRNWQPCTGVSSAGWLNLAKHRRSICIAKPIAHPCR